MTLAYQISTGVSVVLFLFYGLACLFAEAMKADFERWGLGRLRLLTGTLEVLGALGLVVGQFVPVLVIVSAGGLALMMALGLATRVRFGDAWWESVPAAVLLVVNAFIVWQAIARV